MKKYQVELTLTEPILGSTPKDEELFANFVQSKAADLSDDQAAQELATLENLGEKGYTGFHANEEGKPIIYAYVIKGFFKAAAKANRRITGSLSGKMKAYLQIINTIVFVFPNQIVIEIPEGQEMGTLERPLRASTPQGERVALAKSDTLPAGSKLRFEVVSLEDKVVSEALIREWFSYGQFSGLGQWRNAGHGRFEYTMEEIVEQG